MYLTRTCQPTDRQRADSGKMECSVCWTVDPSRSCLRPQAAEGATAATVAVVAARSPAVAGAVATVEVVVEVDAEVEIVAAQEMDFQAAAGSSGWNRSPYRREPTALGCARRGQSRGAMRGPI